MLTSTMLTCREVLANCLPRSEAFFLGREKVPHFMCTKSKVNCPKLTHLKQILRGPNEIVAALYTTSTRVGFRRETTYQQRSTLRSKRIIGFRSIFRHFFCCDRLGFSANVVEQQLPRPLHRSTSVAELFRA